MACCRFDNRWSQALLVKHLLIIALGIVGAILQLVVLPALDRASLLREAGADEGEEMAHLQARETRLTRLMLALAALILAISVWLGVL